MADIPIKADISDSANEFLKELALPSAKQVGQALGNVFGLFNTLTLPIKFGNEWAQRNFANYAEKLADIAEEKIKQVEPEIAIPIIEKLSYTSNEDLANAFANLLASASNKEKIDLIHPGFIQKLENLSPDEARFLQYLRTQTSDIPYIIYKAVNSSNDSFVHLSLRLTGLEKMYNLTPRQMIIHLENLVSLNILKDNEGQFKTDDNIYNNLEMIYLESKKTFEENIQNQIYVGKDKLDIDKSFYTITSLGRTFIEACTNS